MMKRIHILATALFLICGFSSAHAEDAIGTQAFGKATLMNIKPVKKNPGECLSFEASFSESLDKNPSAVVDIERHFANLVSAAVLEVVRIPNENKYRLTLTAKTAEGCPKILDESLITISTYSGKDVDDERQTIPQAITFKAEKNRLTRE